MNTSKKNTGIERPPIVVVMGHIDHGKSTLLDRIRQSNTTDAEVGGITQRIGAYEVAHTDVKGTVRRITFIDTPGHAAFEAMRARGAAAADIAILVVSAEEGVKAQTLEAWKRIMESGMPYVIALNKIDRPESNIERTLAQLAENGIYVEGRGGDVPYVPVSAKTGEGATALLEIVLLLAELHELTADPALPAEGFVIESSRDPKRGIAATLIITNGRLAKGMHIAAGHAIAPVRIMEDSLGKPIDAATFSSPVRIVGFSSLPPVGETFRAFSSRTDAEEYAARPASPAGTSPEHADTAEVSEEETAVIPVIVKADVIGVAEAVAHELLAYTRERLIVKIIGNGVGAVTEGDVKAAGSDARTVVIAFNVSVERGARDIAERIGITVVSFDIIYKLTEWFEALVKERTPKRTVETVRGRLKVLKDFSRTRDRQIIGGRVEEGSVNERDAVKILRRGEIIGEGVVVEVQKAKSRTREAAEGEECGLKVESRTTIAPGDVMESRVFVEQ